MPFLDWVNKSQAVQVSQQVPYHLLRQVSAHGNVEGPYADNLLIQGDNLLALKALLPFYRGQVKCIFIDPPYNTQSAFEHYDDRLEHSQWLSMMYPRLVLLRELLAENGSIWVTLDDNEAHYCKVLMDEVFGRQNYIANVVWQKKSSPSNDATWISDNHDHVHCYAKNKRLWRPIKLERTEAQNAIYQHSDEHDGVTADGQHFGRGPWFPGDMTVKTISESGLYPVVTPSGRTVYPASGRAWVYSKEKFSDLLSDHRITFGRNGSNKPCIKRFLTEVETSKIVPRSVWLYEEVGENRNARQEVKKFNETKPFSTPKPERLLQRITHIATNPGDLILDSFLGSGTTAAVAHKMGRRYIGIEMGEHAQTHCLPRLQKVIDGEQGGISQQVGWQGGGGFRFCKLGSPTFDANGTIHPEVKFSTLAGYLWHFETGTPGKSRYDKPRLGVHNGTAYYLLYNGILGDRRPEGGNVLTASILQMIEESLPHPGPKVIYGETTSLGTARLAKLGISFKQIPYDIPLQ